MSKNYIQIDPKDNIIVAITDLVQGTKITVQDTTLLLAENIKQKHKFALKDFHTGDEIVMYGVMIGKAIEKIAKGTAITINNIVHASSKFKNSEQKFTWNAPDTSKI